MSPSDNSSYGKAKHSLLALVTMHTGYVGEESAEVVLVSGGTDLDQLTHEMAHENAQSYNREGEYECPKCGGAGSQGDCEDCGELCDWVENEGVEGTAYLFHPSYLSRTGDPAEQILEWLMELKAITWNQQSITNSVKIHLDVIHSVMVYDFESFCDMLDHNISGEFYISETGENGKYRTIGEAEVSCRSSANNHDRLFGGLTLADIQKNIDSPKINNQVISDLIAYIRELEQK